MRIAAIVPAAGIGRRMGLSTEKQFLSLRGGPIIVHTLKVLARQRDITEIYLVAPVDKIDFCRAEFIDKYNFAKKINVIAGGKERQDSVANGLACLGKSFDLVLVHDGVRPLVSRDTIERVIEAAMVNGAAIAALPVKETIKEVNAGGLVENTLAREKLFSVQTPQVFRYPLIKKAFERAASEGFYGTDEASLVEHMGGAVKVVAGNPENIKITTPEDLVLAEALLLKG